jgi:hypothetical protein
MGPAEIKTAPAAVEAEARAVRDDSENGALDKSLAQAADIAEFWRICCFYAYKALNRIAIGGPDKPGGRLMSLRNARRIARKTIEDFESSVEDERLALLKAENAEPEEKQ